jgi:broad specificity phosphatase PhoE
VAFEAENYADWLDVFAGGEPNRFELVNRLRSEAGTHNAESWDDYWRRAKPLLETVWDAK